MAGRIPALQNKQICLDNYDRLSHLPEVLISHILSLLPTEQAVQTSVLSRKWRYKWTSLTVLSFRDCPSSRTNKLKKSIFMSFVERALLLHDNSKIQEFRLYCTHSYEAARVHAWITNIIMRQVPKLHLTFLSMPLEIPECLLGCDALTELSLYTRGSLWPLAYLSFPLLQGYLSFPRLKRMSLYKIRIPNVSSAGTLLFKFPKLEALTFSQCKWLNVQMLCIDAPLLECCTIENSDYTDLNEESNPCTVKVSGPRLVKFYYRLISKEKIFLSDASTITDAVVDVGYQSGTNNNSPVQVAEVCLRACILLRALFSVENLTLKGYRTIEALALFGNSSLDFPVFYNLTKLVLDTWAEQFTKAFKFLLLHSPVLESLIFEGVTPNWEEGQIQETEGIPCLLSHLKVVKFRNFYAQEKEIGIVKFLLENTQVLKELGITFCKTHWNAKFKRNEVKKLLRGFPKASASARLVFQSSF